MKRNSPEFSHSRPQRQQESKIEGIKTIGIISTPIVWPVKQRPLHFSKNSSDDNPERKNPYSLFLPTLSTPASSEENGNKTLSAYTENTNLDYTVMDQLPNENILNYSRSSFRGTSGAADAVTEPPVSAAVPLLHSRNPSAELARTLASRLHLSDSEPSFHSPVSSSSSSTVYEHEEETLWISSSNSDTTNFVHTSNVLEPVNWWNEPVFHHRITSDTQEDRHHFLSGFSVPPTGEKPPFQKSRLDLLDLAPDNFYLEMIEGNADRKTFSTLSANSEFQFRKSVHIKDHHSGGITNLTSVEILHAKPTSFFQNMKKSYTKFMHGSQLTNSVQRHSKELLTFSSFLVEPGWTSSAFKHVVTTLPVYQQLLTDTYLKSDSIFISSSNYWSHYLQHSLYFQNPSETLRNGALENNLDAFHDSNENEESSFSIFEPENMNPVADSWDSDYSDFPTKSVDISPSLRASFWTVSHHLKEASQVFSGEPSENFWLSFNKLLSSPTESLLSISLYANSDSISEQTSAIRFVGHRAEESNFSSHLSTLETQIFSSLIPGISKRISESNFWSISQLQSTMSFANLTVTSHSEFYFDFPSLEAPFIQSSVWEQVSPFDQVLENSADSLPMQIQTDIVSDQTGMAFLNNRHQPVSVFPTHSGTQPSCSRDSRAPFLISTSGAEVTWRVKSLTSSARTHKTQQSQSLLENDTITNTIDKPRSKVQKDAGIFLKSISSTSSDFFPVSLELQQFLHSESEFRDSVTPNTYSTPPLPQSFQNHLDTITPSLLPQWDVEELNLPTTEAPRNYLTVLGQNSVENQADGPRYSLWAVEKEIIDNDKDIRDFAVLTSTNIPRLSEWNSVGEVYRPFSRSREAISTSTANALDFENADYGHLANLSSVLESSRTAIMSDVVPLPSSYSRVFMQHKETILTGTLTTAAAAIHHSLVQIQTSISSVTYHESSVSAHVYSLANLPSGTSQNSTSYPPLKQLTSSAAVLLPCLCDFFTELGCLCRPEFHYSMSSC
ncbi:uncharacterized protein LOC132325043 [Haemorhous mexicanus]|uniref:uncharacterized protein LOC132325043 n=1 Tax=Haemorhous mexicanus TaxID=30427 RepID=UPI0028BE8BB5|nr:uncharacterized protein LOC132325043 [Haemorhous mexicanus]